MAIDRSAVLAWVLVLSSCGPGAPPAPRTIHATFTTSYLADDGTPTTVPGLPPYFDTPSAVLVDDGGGGWRRFPVAVGADGVLDVPGVPAGRWYLQLDSPTSALAPDGTDVEAVATTLVPLHGSSPDLSTVFAGRPDTPAFRQPASFTLHLEGLEPLAEGQRIDLVGAQCNVYQEYYIGRPDPLGGTSLDGAEDWFHGLLPGFPDAGRGDVVYWYQRSNETVTMGGIPVRVRRPVRFARDDRLTVRPGEAVTLAATLAPPPDLGALDVDVRTSRFAELASDVSPRARLSSFTVGRSAVPHAASYPGRPRWSPRALVSASAAAATDLRVTLPYGRFLPAPWTEAQWLEVDYVIDEASRYPLWATLWHLEVPRPGAPAPAVFTPIVGPPTRPLIDGRDAFQTQPGVSLQPTLSWSPPRLGSPTSYLVTVLGDAVQRGETAQLSILVDGATSVTLPPGFLTAGTSYRAVITARQAPWDGPGRLPFREGAPLDLAECDTAWFVPSPWFLP